MLKYLMQGNTQQQVQAIWFFVGISQGEHSKSVVSRCPVDVLTRFAEIYKESKIREDLLSPIIEFIHNLA